MGHEILLYGVICGATNSPGDEFRKFQLLNESVISSLPPDNNHPWVDRSIFSLPGAYPVGTYRAQLIHIGLSMKDDPYDKDLKTRWLAKFENVLSQLYWEAATLTVETDFDPFCEQLVWKPTESALRAMYASTVPINEWTVNRYKLKRDKLVSH